eukprot:TRINITY_DN3538_c1_g1_i1.p1 TRINITY_DN3538_c1_g1~~TRINITY_DN3538_c1_g1_i1.p1  ORF type:complete len:339 (+),score=143.65 TRINITY_DN3538_c1_g1_i1:68-1084(+)
MSEESLEEYLLKEPSFEEIIETYHKIKSHVHHTPLLTCSTLNQLSNKNLFFKCELFQKVGAFKYRGACNAVLSLPEEVASKGVITHSSGNHAQALACAALNRSIPSFIVMPSNSPVVKRNAVEFTYKAKVFECEPNQAAREATCAEVKEKTKATFIHPYNNRWVIAGQASIAIELLQYDLVNTKVDAIIVPIGGGGMISGISIAAKNINPNIRIIAAEPAAADDAKRSFETGELQQNTTPPRSIADGLLTSMGSLTWSIVQSRVERVITVSEQQIIEAMKLVWERMKLIIEPSAAVGVAVALTEEFKNLEHIQNVAIILCGGNVDLDKLPWVNQIQSN